MRFSLLIISVIFLSACKKNRLKNDPEFYSDDFEKSVYLNQAAIDALFEDDSLWSFNQLTREQNNFDFNSDTVHSGTKSLRFSAEASGDGASKCSIAKQNLAFLEGETVKITAWYYLVGEAKLDYLFLIDMEERTPIGAGPGMRLTLVDNLIAIERNKMMKSTLFQDNGIQFPRNEWVKIEWITELSRRKKGSVLVYQNNELIIQENEIQTMPKDFLYNIQGTGGVYQSFEFGITANSNDNKCELFLDDVVIQKL
jgi:hypothetical protein